MRKKTILITGASGNIGYELIRGLKEISAPHKIIAADYKPDQAGKVLSEFKNLEYRKLDFADPAGFEDALEGIDIVFLLRPPQLADIPKYFIPFLEAMKSKGINQIVFLSVQGVENQKGIPHYKLEKAIHAFKMDHIFLRPAYFMQNLTTTLIQEIKSQNRIYIPAGKLKFNWVDARDIGLTGAHLINNFKNHKNNSFEITGSEFNGFDTVAKMLTEQTGRLIRYVSPALLRFIIHKKKQGIKMSMIFVMIMLHYLPRFSKNAEGLTDTVVEITGKKPGTLKEFIAREAEKFNGNSTL